MMKGPGANQNCRAMVLHPVSISLLHAPDFSQLPLCCASVGGLAAMAWSSGTLLSERYVLRDVEEEGWTKSAPGVEEVLISILWELRCSRGKRWWWGTPPGIVCLFVFATPCILWDLNSPTRD